MAKIQLLDQKTIDNIAAGEVIERPASVVKELVENAVDAKANAVTVEIKDGGMTLIRVTDNGIGIPKDQVKTAFLRHATSKIRSVEDLLSVSSLGFRGEALSSISAVAQVELVTKTAESFSGVSYKIYGGEEEAFDDIGAPDGTTFLVKNLFYNTPARRKFLKSATTEAGYVEQMMVHIALSHPEISFKFIHNNKNKIYTSGNGKVKDIIYHIYGRDVAGALIPLEAQNEDVKVTGFVAKPYVSRGNRNYESYFINGRYIKSSIIYKAIEEGYRTFTMKHRYPFVCLDFKIDQELLDVNVHPTKMEIRFRNGREIYELVVDAVRAALLQKDLVQDVLRETPKKKELPKTKEVKKPEPFEVNRRKEEVQKVDQQGQGVQQQVEKQRQAVQQQIEKPSHPVKKTLTASESSKNTKKPTYAGLNYNTQKKEFPQYKTDELSSNQMTLREDPVFSVQARADRKILGQLFKTYWLIEYEDQLFIMDQHAAHEKVNYERLMKNFKEKEIYSQRLEPPMVVTVSMTEAEALTRYKDAFAGLGFTIESFGGNEYCIREVPANLYGIGERDLFMELLDAVSQENGTLDTEVIASKIATMACKMSIKGNQRVSLMEVEHLLDELMKLENPYQCPHGRPTIIKMSKYEIDKKFKRIV
ncbi:DNA mismatch repair endonuclease MutL [Anaerostipes hadrus]|uniref:DNA mismatch repair endonuclease MutL n=1 Tax=Anaerostipes TaxID=207244 RepID=UPI001C01CF51|nr:MULTISPECIES: DNA mismatch repair endonuclease MutL [Anaerostipes]MBT9941113.1 DNA mismatch repair endonuclease MutL [Anaerostipes hadrus]